MSVDSAKYLPDPDEKENTMVKVYSAAWDAKKAPGFTKTSVTQQNVG